MPDMQLHGGLYYHIDASIELLEALHYIRKNLLRVRIFYGDKTTGEMWLHQECGYIHKTAGEHPQPVILYNSGKFAGANQLLEHCIMRIEYANKKDGGALYEYKPNIIKEL